MPEQRTVLRLDPWPPEYDSAVQFGEIETEIAGVIDTTVEITGWEAIRPQSRRSSPNLCFVDGVRRVEARVIADVNHKPVHGLFGSTGVGYTKICDQNASFSDLSVERFLILGAGLKQSDVIRVGNRDLSFEGVSSSLNSPNELLGELQNLMRTFEADLGQRLAASGACVFADGPLTYYAIAKQEVVGIIKSIYLPYLSPEHFAIVSTLESGCRTPLFAIKDGKYNRYSWFLRVAKGRAVDHALAGILRLEVREAIGVDRAKDMADLSATELPRFASSSIRDPRAPQNLLPIGALESELRRQLGDSVLVRRGIEKRLLEGGSE